MAARARDRQSSSCALSETDDTCADVHRPPLSHSEHMDEKLEPQTHTHSLTHVLPHSGRQTHAVIQSPLSLSDRDSCLSCFGASHSPPPFLPLPGPSEPQLSQSLEFRTLCVGRGGQGEQGIMFLTWWLLERGCLAGGK